MPAQLSSGLAITTNNTESNNPPHNGNDVPRNQSSLYASQHTLCQAGNARLQTQTGQHDTLELNALPQQQTSTINSTAPGVQAASTQTTLQEQPPFCPSQSITIHQKDREPWRYRGYPAFCKWMATDQDFFVLRRFSESSVRVSLFMQDRIAALEEELAQEDLLCQKAPGSHNGTFRNDPSLKRRALLDELSDRLRNYHQFIINQRHLHQTSGATKPQIRNVRRWLEAANRPIKSEEAEFIEKERDLIPVLSQDRTPLRRFLERFDFIKLLCIKQRNINKDTFNPDDFEMQTTVITKHSHLDKFVFCTIIFLGLGMLIGPLWWLNHLAVHAPNLAPRLLVITGFLILFVLLISLMTIARPFEVLAATAAYGALLMVFMQLGHAK